jgi:hypothetical protein
LNLTPHQSHDPQVTRTEPTTVAAAQAYLLFYSARDKAASFV